VMLETVMPETSLQHCAAAETYVNFAA